MTNSPKHFKPTLTIVLIGLNVIVYVCTSVIGGDPLVTADAPIYFLGQVNYLVLGYGWYWQLFTSMLVHANIVHLAGNMVFLLIFGLRAEELFETKEYLLIFFLSGLAGNLLTLLMGPESISVGASGAIFGVFGACIIYIRKSIGQSVVSALMFASFLLLVNLGPGVNILAHVGGLVLGLLIGYGLAVKRRTQSTYYYGYSYETA